MSKKLAAGAQAIVLDVKVGDGAFMKTIDDARRLARLMLSLGQEAGREVVCLLTDMDQPLGAAVGNALEVREALATIRGQGPSDFTELVLDASARLLALSDLGVDRADARRRAEAAVTSHGGDRNPSLPELQSCLKILDNPRTVRVLQDDTILYYFQVVALASQNSAVPLLLQEVFHLGLSEVMGNGNREADHCPAFHFLVISVGRAQEGPGD